MDRQLALPGESGAQRLALDVWHDVVEDPGRLTRVVQREDVGVLELSRKFDLAEEALGAKRGGELRAEYLEGNQTLVSQVPREIDRGHPALPELALDGVAVTQGVNKL